MNNKAFDWDLIRSFLAALEHGSLLGAARALKSSQPTLGRHIAELEKQLGVALFERTGRGLKATATAMALADNARLMEHAALQLANGLAQAQQGVAGTVRLSASTPIACFLLPPILLRLREALPEVQIELVAENKVTNLLRREADIAVRMVVPQQSSLIAKRIGQVTVGAYAAASYLKTRGAPRKPQDLAKHELIGFDRDTSMLRGLASSGMVFENTAFALRTDDLIAYWALVRAGAGIGFVADYLARTEPQVRRVLPQMKIPALPVWLAVHREIRGSPRIRAVYDFLALEVGQALAL